MPPTANNNYGGQNPPAADPSHPVSNPLSVMEPGEQIICEVRRHPIGILGIYSMTGLLLIVLAILAFVVAPHISSSGHQAAIVGALLFVVIGIGALAFVLIAHIVYWGNSWVVTSDSITQITQTSLFRKQSSQLSLGNLEDVTTQQNGPLQHMFNYGVLRVETAGERSKFMFPFCPNPSYYAKQILAAREAFEQGRSGEAEQRLYRQEGSYQQAYQAPPTYQAPAEPAPNPAPSTFQIPTAPPPEPIPPAPQVQPFDDYAAPLTDTMPFPGTQSPPTTDYQIPQMPQMPMPQTPPPAYQPEPPPPDPGVNIGSP